MLVLVAILALALVTVGTLAALQFVSGRNARAYLAYNRARTRVLHSGETQPRRKQQPRTIPRPTRSSPGAPRLAWCHNGWAHADEHLVGVDLLDERYAVTAFGSPARFSGDPPVSVELLPEIRRGGTITLDGLEQALGGFDVMWAGGAEEGTTWQGLNARARGGPAILCFTVENVLANFGEAYHPLRRRAAQEVDHFWALSAQCAAVLELDGVEADRITIGGHQVDMPELSEQEHARLRGEARRDWGFEENDLVVLFIGRAVWEKGLQVAMSAAAWLEHGQNTHRVRWLVAGDGPEVHPAREIAKTYGLESSVTFAGAVRGPTRHRAYAAADIVVVPSLPMPTWLEQFGRVIPEAHAFALPVVGSSSGSIAEVIGPGGITVPPGDFIALAHAIDELRDDAARERLGRLGRAHARERYSPRAFADRVAEALERAREHRARVV